MGMCKQCGEVYASVDLKDGVCLTCRAGENSIKTDNSESIKDIEKNVIFCKECGVKNDINSVQCQKCGSMLQVANTPLSGEERLKIVGFFAFLALPFFWFGGSVIIVVIVIASLYVMKKDKKFTVIEKSREYIKYYLLLLAYSPLIIYSIVLMISLFSRGYQNGMIYAGLLTIFGFLVAKPLVNLFLRIFDYLYFNIVEQHKEWILENCMFSDKTVAKEDNSIEIMGRDKLSSFSIADELMKWKEMLDKGLITQDEFDKAKQKLLNDGD